MGLYDEGLKAKIPDIDPAILKYISYAIVGIILLAFVYVYVLPLFQPTPLEISLSNNTINVYGEGEEFTSTLNVKLINVLDTKTTNIIVRAIPGDNTSLKIMPGEIKIPVLETNGVKEMSFQIIPKNREIFPGTYSINVTAIINNESITKQVEINVIRK